MNAIRVRGILLPLLCVLGLLVPTAALAGEEPTPTTSATVLPTDTPADGTDPGTDPGTDVDPDATPTVVVTETVTIEVPVEVPADGGDPGFGSAGPGDDGLTADPEPGISIPRVMLTEFITEPGSVVAGDAVNVSFTLQNMSRTTRVNNLKVTLSADDAGAFLPVNGSASTFISTIRAEASVSRSMALRTLPTLEERPYSLTLKIEYEDALANPYESSEQVAIPVTQVVRADTSSPQVMPPQIMAGQQTTVTFSVNNLGKNKLFNAKASIPEGQPVAAQEVFVGNIEPGASGDVEMTLQAVSESSEPVALLITYEDAEGTVTTLEQTIGLVVMPEMMPEEEWPVEEWPEEEFVEPGMSGTMMLVIAGAIIALLAVIIALATRARRRRRARDKDSDMALLDGDPLVPTDSL